MAWSSRKVAINVREFIMIGRERKAGKKKDKILTTEGGWEP